jgi:hypothetical protein
MWRKSHAHRQSESLFKILIEFDCVAFDENSSRIRFDFVQKHRFKANDSFKPVC